MKFNTCSDNKSNFLVSVEENTLLYCWLSMPVHNGHNSIYKGCFKMQEQSNYNANKKVITNAVFPELCMQIYTKQMFHVKVKKVGGHI